MSWETVIGLETHVELLTRTKLFCGCAAAFGGAPNTRCCPVCLGLPGALPVLNGRAVELAVRAALALGCRVERRLAFDRKHYFYPDLPKGYQISQLYGPVGQGGGVDLPSGRRVRLRELHLEEDAGKLLHGGADTRVDWNRCGVPLLEIVTQPELCSGEEAGAYLTELRSILRYLEVSDGKLEEGSLRCDVNLSVRRQGDTALGTRTELKNLGSLRAVRLAAEYEAARQIALLEGGGTVTQETRRWDEAQGVTLPMRAKEAARDYRYFPEPDLPPLALSEAEVEALRRDLPRLAAQRALAYRTELGLSDYDAGLLAEDRVLSDFFEQVTALGAPAKEAANWLLGQVRRRLSQDGITAKEMRLTPDSLAGLIAMVEEGRLNRSTGVRVFDAVFGGGVDPEAYVRVHGLGLISDPAAVGAAVRRVLTDCPGPLEDWRRGKEKALEFLLGQVMRALGGRADPALVRAELLRGRNQDERSNDG